MLKPAGEAKLERGWSCPSCHHNKVVPLREEFPIGVDSGGAQYSRIEERSDIVACDRCGLIYLVSILRRQ